MAPKRVVMDDCECSLGTTALFSAFFPESSTKNEKDSFGVFRQWAV